MLILCFAAVLLGVYDTASDVAFVAHIQWTCKSTLFLCRVCVAYRTTGSHQPFSPSFSPTVTIIDHEWVGISVHGQCAVGRHCGYYIWDWDGHIGLILVCRLVHPFLRCFETSSVTMVLDIYVGYIASL